MISRTGKDHAVFLSLTFVILFLSFSLPGSSLFGQATVGSADDSIRLSIDTIVAGTDSAYPCQTPVLLILRDQEDWQRAWSTHHGKDLDKHGLPEIDFTVFSVIALFSGRRAGVEAIAIAGLDHRDDVLYVSAVEVEPGLGCEPAKNMRNAFHFVRAPSIDKHTGITLEIEILSRQCSTR